MNFDQFLNILYGLRFGIYIILHRKNYLRKQISGLNFKQFDIRHTNITGTTPKKVFIDTEKTELFNEKDGLIKTYDYYDQYFKSLTKKLITKKTLYLTYEDDILPDPRIAYQKICKLLEINIENPKVNLKRTNPFALNEMIENYDETCDALTGTKHEWMLHY